MNIIIVIRLAMRLRLYLLFLNIYIYLMKNIELMQVTEWKPFYRIETTYAVSNTETLEIKKEIVLNNFNLN